MANKAISTLAVGSIIKLNESGSPVEFYVCKHDYESALNGSGRTLVVRKDCYDKRAFSSINNAFSGSSMDTWLNNTWLKLLDADIQALISTTKFYCLAGNGSAGKQTLTRAVFLLSVTELRKGGSSYNDGTALDSAVCDQLAIAYCNGSAESQWTRTPSLSGNTTVLSLSSSGELNIYSAYYSTCGSRPAFTLPSTTLVDDSGNVVTVDLTAHKTLVNGTAYTVQGGKCMVDGTVYNILKGRTLIDGTGWDITFPSAGTKLSTLDVGQSVFANVGGVKKEFLVVHQGLPSSLYDSSCDGTWLLMKDCYETRQWHSSNYNVYESSTINTYLNGAFFGLFDANIQEIIKQVKIPYRALGSNGSDKYGSGGLSCKAFLLSGPEVGLAGKSSMPKDGAKLDYFDATVGASPKRVAYLNGSFAYWWLRSPSTDFSGSVWAVYTDGRYGYNAASNSLYAIRPCIILPSTTLVDDEFELIA